MSQDSNDNSTTRRGIIAAASLAAPFLLPRQAEAQQAAPRGAQPARTPRPIFAYVGSFTSAQRRARDEGISVFRVDAATGGFTPVQILGDLVNPSFLITSRDQRFLYSVHGDGEHATSFAIDQASGRITRLNQGATGGRNGVRQQIDASGRWMIVANYATSTVGVLPVRPDGSLGDQQHLVELPGTPGPHRSEQPRSEPHDVAFDPSGRFVVIPDKGVDRVFVFALDAATGRLTPAGNNGFVASRSGAGPRHCAFHPTRPVLWVLNELDSTITTYRWNGADGTLTPAQVITMLPTDFTGNSTCSGIAVSADGRFVYASNRGHDSVAVLAARPDTGLLSQVGWTPTQGRTPRFIGFGPGKRFLYAANENSDTILVFRPDARTGRLTQVGPAIACKSPVTIAFTS